MRKTEIVRCVFCGAPAIFPGIIRPAMCERHYWVARIVSIMERSPVGVTVPAVQRTVEEVAIAVMPDEIGFTAKEVPGLLWDLLQSYKEVFGGRRD